MIKKLLTSTVIPLLTFSSFLLAESKYDIHEIDTLQTHSSEAIALNNNGQILGWYNIDGSKDSKYFFVKDTDGSFHGISNRENGANTEINWRYLTSDGKAYGTFDGNTNFSVLYMWDQKNGTIKLGNLPGKDITAINNNGHVLIKSITETNNGKSITIPILWDHGNITRLKGVEGDLGIESEQSLAWDMNDKGEVVGQSIAYLVYKNNIYKQVHAVKWLNGKAIDLHRLLPKSAESKAIAINNEGDILVSVKSSPQSNEVRYLLKNDGRTIALQSNGVNKINNIGYSYFESMLLNNDGKTILNKNSFNDDLRDNMGTIWVILSNIACVNDKGEVIANGQTIYGEKHAMLLRPKNTEQ